MENDIAQRLSSMSEEDAKSCLEELIQALHEENTDKAYAVLREWNLEQDLEDMP